MKWAIENGTSTFFGRKSLFKNHDYIYISYFIYTMPFCQLSPSPSNGFAASSTRHFRTRGGQYTAWHPTFFIHMISCYTYSVSSFANILLYSPHSQELCDEINKAQQEKGCSHESLEARIRLGYMNLWSQLLSNKRPDPEILHALMLRKYIV